MPLRNSKCMFFLITIENTLHRAVKYNNTIIFGWYSSNFVHMKKRELRIIKLNWFAYHLKSIAKWKIKTMSRLSQHSVQRNKLIYKITDKDKYFHFESFFSIQLWLLFSIRNRNRIFIWTSDVCLIGKILSLKGVLRSEDYYFKLELSMSCSQCT